jgi:hypothetical protein
MRATSGEGIFSGERVERRLAAILAADVRGSSAPIVTGTTFIFVRHPC